LTSKKKILSPGSLNKTLLRLRREGKSIAFTNGCFDILHLGHIRYLEAAQRPDRVLVVGLNSDSSVKKIKGPGRPVTPQNQRVALIAALACVDYVTIFHETTPLKIIEALRPDILIKGSDWKAKEVVGADFVRSYGGKVEFIRYLKNFSTTKIIQSIIKKCQP
jgi:D-beta-D-heptose 7-phosphate kinase/D-beta-D-heptose 1-phosphate adenosyltransferase